MNIWYFLELYDFKWHAVLHMRKTQLLWKIILDSLPVYGRIRQYSKFARTIRFIPENIDAFQGQ